MRRYCYPRIIINIYGTYNTSVWFYRGQVVILLSASRVLHKTVRRNITVICDLNTQAYYYDTVPTFLPFLLNIYTKCTRPLYALHILSYVYCARGFEFDSIDCSTLEVSDETENCTTAATVRNRGRHTSTRAV